MEIHHIGYAVRDIVSSAQAFRDLGYKESSGIVDDVARNIKILFMKNSEGYTIELVEPVNERASVYNALKKNGEGPYHICYIVDDIEHALDELKKKKYMIVCKPQKAKAIDDKLVAFLYNIRVGLIELVER